MQYLLMHKRIPVVPMEIDESTGAITFLGALAAPQHLPIGIAYSGAEVDRKSLNDWWSGRSIPASRSGLREALETMGVSSPQLLLTKCFGLSLSDQYWVCPENSGLKWEDVNFFDHPFSDDVGNILFGDAPANDDIDLTSPDNTSDGQLRKKWKVIDGKRCLLKGGSNPAQQEPYNEAIASAIMRRLGIAHIPYSVELIDETPYSVCEDFITPQTELVSAWHIMQTSKKLNHMSNYQHYLYCCQMLGIPGVADALDRMLAVDFLIVNEDRHLNNFGAVRNAETLAWIGAAPIFDCGTSMWHDRFTEQIQPLGKQTSKPFRTDHAEQIKLVKSWEWLDFSALKGIDEEFREIVKGSPSIDEARLDALCYGLKKRAQLLQENVRTRGREGTGRDER
ncbi:MAG: excisionase [Oscillospiraceae bacterium]|jgi:hypothetical protein|nr:excisionase [Oscillospiraceae bacterium]